jgi:hypothetical protein
MFGFEDTKPKPKDVKGASTEAQAHDQAPQAPAEFQERENPHEWKNMNKAQKAALIIGAIGTAFTGYANPELAFAQQKELFGKRTEFDVREEKRRELHAERKHEIKKIEKQTEGQLTVQEVVGDQAAERQQEVISHEESQLGRQLAADATRQRNDLNFRADLAVFEFFGEQQINATRMAHERSMQGAAFGQQKSMALLQDQIDRSEELRGYLFESYGPEGVVYAEEIMSQVQRYFDTGELGEWSPEAADALEIATKRRSMRVQTEQRQAELELLASAKELATISGPAGEKTLEAGSPEFALYTALAGGINSLASPESVQVGVASLQTTPQGQQFLQSAAQLSERSVLPSAEEVNILASNIAQMPVPLNPVVAREILFNVGADVADVDAAIPLPEGSLALDFSEEDPQAAREKKIYGHVIEPALERADHVDREFGRVLRIWHDKNQSGDVRADQAQLWRLIKTFQGSDATFRSGLMDHLAGGRKQVGTTGMLGMPRTVRR